MWDISFFKAMTENEYVTEKQAVQKNIVPSTREYMRMEDYLMRISM
jgi:hypothetical protein